MKISFTYIGKNRVQIDVDNVAGFNKLQHQFMAVNEGAAFAKTQYVTTHYYAISPMGTFKLGMFSEVYRVAKTIFDDVVVDSKIIKNLMPFKNCEYNTDILSVPNASFVYRDYQKTALDIALKIGRGIILSPTASGKSLIIAGLLHNILAKNILKDYQYILLLLSSRQLVDQMYSDFVDYGLTSSQKYSSGIQGHPTDIDKCENRIIISNRQWLQSEIRINKLPDIGSVFVDECHTIKESSKVTKFVDRIPTSIRFGCTGTLDNNIQNEWMTKGVIGTQIFKESISTLQDRGYLSKINIVALKFLYSIKNVLKDGIYKREERENPRDRFDREFRYFLNSDHILLNLLRIISTFNGNTLILFDYLETGRKVKEIFDSAEIKDRFRYIDGRVKTAVREEIRAELENNTGIMLFAQSITFNTGINIKNLHNIVFLFTSKAPVKIIQSIGRGLRVTDGKDGLNLFDISSNLRYSKKHFNKREELYYESYEKKPDHVIQINAYKNIDREFCKKIKEKLI